MSKNTPTPFLLYAAILFLLILASCSSKHAEVPFPVNDSTKPQPVSQPLQFGAPKKINWATIKSGEFNMVTKKLDLDALPTSPYDSFGFKPFLSPPEVAKFDINALPDTALDLNKISFQPISFRTEALPSPTVTKAGMLTQRQGSPLSVSEIGLPQGLPDKAILNIFKDSKGLIWISTENGLYRYDGEYMLRYPNIRSSVGLAEDPQGRIWFFWNRGVGILDPAHQTVSISHKLFCPFPNLAKLTLDENGNFWATQLLDGGLTIIDTKNLSFKKLGRESGILGTFTRGILEDEKKNIWVTSNGGVHIINPDRNKIKYIYTKTGLGTDTLQALASDMKGRVWAAFRHGGFYEFDLNKGTKRTFGESQGFNNAFTYQLLCDNLGRIWMGTRFGLYVADLDHGKSKFFTSTDGFAPEFALGLLQDEQNRVWVINYNTGLLVVSENGEMVHPIVIGSVSTLMEDQKGRIWVGEGTSDGGIKILDKEKKVTRHLTRQQGLGDNFIQNFTLNGDEVWIATNGGIDFVEPSKKSLQHMDKNNGLLNDTIYGILKDQRGNLWFTGPSSGVNKIDFKKKEILHAGVKEGLGDESILDIKVDSRGKIWIATNTNGVEMIDAENGTVQNLSQGPGLKDTCNRLLTPDSVGRMWIGTDRGVYIADPVRNKLTILTTNEGLCNDWVTALGFYQGKFVVGTKNQASVVTPPAVESKSDTIWDIEPLKGSEGLLNTTNNWSTNIVTREGQYIWADAGVTFINGIEPQKTTSETNITGYSVMNETQSFFNYKPLAEKDTLWEGDKFFLNGQSPAVTSFAQTHGLKWDSISGPYNMPLGVKLPHNLNYLQFQFGQQHLGRPDAALYSYFLEGIDKKWSPFNTNTSTDNYLNLPPGHYTFKVRSKDLGGNWTRPATFSFEILPPWWQTWWMYVVYALAIAGVIVGYNKYRSLALVKEKRVLEESVEARTKEVKQQAEELTTINQISQALVGQANLNDLIKLVGDELKDLFKANVVYVALLDKKTKIINFPYQYGDNMPPMKLGEGLTSKIILTGKPLLINKDVHQEASVLGISRIGVPAASYLGVPIPVSDEIIGVLSIQSTEEQNRFAEKDKNLLVTIAANVGVAIRKARLYEEVKQANTEADAARKTAEEANAAKSAFLSTVSHELRTPLTSVLGFAKITKKRLEEKIFPITDKSDPKTIKTIEQISGNLNVVIAEGERLTNLINDVLELAKIEAGKMEWSVEAVQVSEVVERAIAATSSLFDQKGLKLERNIQTELPEISGDRDKLIQVVVNLLSNAVKFTKEGAVTCRVFQENGSIVVGITDTGIGIAPEDHDKVFEQFKQVGDTLTDKPKGTGLGLPICKEIVEHHKGKIWLDSDLGQGSTFYFSLPLMKAEEAEVKHIHLDDLLKQLKRRVQQSQPALNKSNATILVVDDDDGIRSLLKQELGEAGYVVEEAANGKEAVNKIRTVRPDLVILDVMMPEMNGFDVAAILKNDPQTMEIPIIILSIVQDKSRGFRIGVDRYLTKPIDTSLLFSEIGNLLEQGKSRKKVMVVDEDSVTVKTLADVLQARGYQVVESDGKEMVEKAIASQPDIIILNSVLSDKHEIVKTLRFEKGLENVLFLIYQ